MIKGELHAFEWIADRGPFEKATSIGGVLEVGSLLLSHASGQLYIKGAVPIKSGGWHSKRTQTNCERIRLPIHWASFSISGPASRASSSHSEMSLARSEALVWYS
jgi:hypothetical protein